MFTWWQQRRRNRVLAVPPPPQWHDWLQRNVWQYRLLDPRRQQRVQQFVQIMRQEKDWVGGNQLVVTDQMCVTIAGQAALMTLGFERPYYFDRLKTIVIYPGLYSARPHSAAELILGEHQPAPSVPEVRSGESWQGGPIVLAWQVVLRNGRERSNRHSVVIHEFAHHMDSLDGFTDGAPPMTDYQFERQWYRTTASEYRRLVQQARSGEKSLLDGYGATSQAEFFAVAAECFFTQPHDLALEHVDLFDVLVRLFGQDPREWLPAADAPLDSEVH